MSSAKSTTGKFLVENHTANPWIFESLDSKGESHQLEIGPKGDPKGFEDQPAQVTLTASEYALHKRHIDGMVSKQLFVVHNVVA